MHIVDDEQRSDRRPTPMRPSGSGLEGASASLALLDDVHRHRLRRAALHLPLPSQERGPFQFSDRLLVLRQLRQIVCLLNVQQDVRWHDPCADGSRTSLKTPVPRRPFGPKK